MFVISLLTLLCDRLLHEVIHNIQCVSRQIIIDFIHVSVIIEYFPHKREELLVYGRPWQHPKYLDHEVFHLCTDPSAHLRTRILLLSDVYHDLFNVFDATDTEALRETSQLQLALVSCTQGIESRVDEGDEALHDWHAVQVKLRGDVH
jgi:hypothetical protein